MPRKSVRKAKDPQRTSNDNSSSAPNTATRLKNHKARRDLGRCPLRPAIKKSIDMCRGGAVSFSAKVFRMIDQFAHHTIEHILSDMAALIRIKRSRRQVTSYRWNRRTLVSARHVQSACRLCLPPEIARHAVAEGTRAITKFTAAFGRGRRRMSRLATRAGLRYPLPYFRRLMRHRGNAPMASTAPVYLTAVIEYLATEVVEIAILGARNRRTPGRRIGVSSFLAAIGGDQELSYMWRNAVGASLGGASPSAFATSRFSASAGKRKRIYTASRPKGNRKKSAATRETEKWVNNFDRPCLPLSVISRMMRESLSHHHAASDDGGGCSSWRLTKDAVRSMRAAAEHELVKRLTMARMVAEGSGRKALVSLSHFNAASAVLAMQEGQ